MKKPTIGQMVLYTCRPTAETKLAVFPAVVVEVTCLSPRRLDPEESGYRYMLTLRVFTDQGDSHVPVRRDVVFHETAGVEEGTWSWRPENA